MKKIFVMPALLMLALLSACTTEEGSLVIEAGSAVYEAASDDLSGQDAQSTEQIVVYICGEVQNPGVYRLPEGSRICDAVEMAGGMTADADVKALNLAQRLSDGQQVTVKGIEEGSSESGSASDDGKVNLNSATKEELMTLSGIGEAKAEAILSYRDEIGWFSSIEEIKNVSGIGDKVYAKIADKIEV